MHVYLAGPIKGKTYAEATTWREFATSQLAQWGHVGVSPMRGKEALRDAGPLLGSQPDGSYPEHPLSSAQGLFRRDIFDVARCDVILANLEGATELSIGTCMEIQRGYDLGKYVITILQPGSVHDHAFVHQASSLVVATLQEALGYFEIVARPWASWASSFLPAC